MPIFATRTMDVFHFLGLGCPRSEELSGSWRLFFWGHGVPGTVGHETVSRLLRKRRENLEVTNKVRIFAHG